MDNGAGSYRRFLDGDDDGIVEIVRDYKDGLIFYINRDIISIFYYPTNLSRKQEL